jgi:hypothetical protein
MAANEEYARAYKDCNENIQICEGRFSDQVIGPRNHRAASRQCVYVLQKALDPFDRYIRHIALTMLPGHRDFRVNF